jgi:hypothetical protein
MLKVLIDISPLRRHPTFRRLWIGSSLSAVGSKFTNFAALYAVWHLTGSSLMVGPIGAASGIPLVVIALAGSMYIDTVDRTVLARRINIAQVFTMTAMAAAASVESVPILIALTAVGAALNAIGGPARRSLTPHVVERSCLSAAYALSSLSFQMAMLIGPALAALVLGHISLPACFLVDALSFLAAVVGLRGLNGPVPEVAEGQRGVAAAVDGIRFVARTPVVRAALLSDLAATVLAMPIALFPALNQFQFDGRPQTLAWFTTALAVGGVTASFASGAVTRRSRPGAVMAVCSLVWGVTLTAVGFSSSLLGSLVLLAIAGAADTWSVTSRTTLAQASTPGKFRGRLSVLEQVVGVGGPNLGNFRAGVAGNIIGPGPAMAIGGVSCVAAVVAIVTVTPALMAYQLTPGPDDGDGVVN